MLPTSARVAQEVYEPLIGIHYPMLCSVKNCSWQIGTVSIRAEDRLATGFRFVNWVHDVPCPEARAAPPPAATNAAYQQIEQWLPMKEKGSDSILVLTTRTSSAQHLQGFFQQSGRQANAETAVKVAGVAYSRATDLTVSACPVNMNGTTGMSQVISALLHGVCTLYTNVAKPPHKGRKVAPRRAAQYTVVACCLAMQQIDAQSQIGWFSLLTCLGSQPVLVASAITHRAPLSTVLMAHYEYDPWAISDHGDDVDMAGDDLDIMDVSEDEHVRTVPYLHSSPEWITQQKQQAFLHGCPHTDHQAKAQAYQALGTPSVAQSFLGLDTNMGPYQIADVRSQPTDKDAGYPTAERRGEGPDTAAIMASLLLHRELIESCGMVYVIVDNRAPEEVEHWPAFAQWWKARRSLVGPQHERTDVLWIQATHANGLRAVPYYWAEVFVLEAARFLFPKVHFGLVDNDCVPVTLFEVKDLIALAESQFRWPDFVGHRADPDIADSKVGMLLFTEAHLEYNAGLVISIGSANRPSPVEAVSTAET